MRMTPALLDRLARAALALALGATAACTHVEYGRSRWSAEVTPAIEAAGAETLRGTTSMSELRLWDGTGVVCSSLATAGNARDAIDKARRKGESTATYRLERPSDWDGMNCGMTLKWGTGTDVSVSGGTDPAPPGLQLAEWTLDFVFGVPLDEELGLLFKFGLGLGASYFNRGIQESGVYGIGNRGFLLPIETGLIVAPEAFKGFALYTDLTWNAFRPKSLGWRVAADWQFRVAGPFAVYAGAKVEQFERVYSNKHGALFNAGVFAGFRLDFLGFGR